MTALIWATTYGNVWLGVKALGVIVPPSGVLLMLVVQSAGMLIPSGPANLGVYQFTTVAAATRFGIDRTSALGISLVLHASRFFPTTFIGLAYFVARFGRRVERSPVAPSPITTGAKS